MSRTGVFVCHCGENIGRTVDCGRVAAEAAKLPGVAFSLDYKYMCSDPGQNLVKKAIKEERLSAHSEKGEALVASHQALFGESGNAEPMAAAVPSAEAFDLKKIKAWLDEHFEDPYWETIATRCAGCGVCAFVCPACHCFDIVDEGTEKKGSRRKSWDACGFRKFTQHASGHNPRDLQPKRYRNRIMHKFKYYEDKFGQTLCTGCGRCIRACPVGIDIAAVLSDINKR